MYKKLRIGLGLVVLLISLGCAKEDTGIPYAPVQFQVLLNDPHYLPLMGAGGHAFVANRGISGVVIYNTGFGYRAYDRCSTVNPMQANAVIWDEEVFSLRDPVSGALFDLATGFPTKAPGKKALQRYSVTVLGPNVLRITN